MRIRLPRGLNGESLQVSMARRSGQGTSTRNAAVARFHYTERFGADGASCISYTLGATPFGVIARRGGSDGGLDLHGHPF